MLTRRVRVQVVAFVLIALVGVSYAGARYAGLDRLFGPRGYVVSVRLADSGGIFRNAEVTYRGVPVGRVGSLRLTEQGVEVPLDINPGAPPIPADVVAVVANRSAVGEQYVDLRPQSEGAPYLDGGSVIPEENTRAPVPVETLLMNLDRFVSSVPNDSLRTVINELGTAFHGNGGHLQTLLDTTREFTAEAQAHLPATRKLLADGRKVLATQAEQGSAIRSFSEDLRLLSEQLRSSDPDLRKLIRNAPPAARQISGFLADNDPQLGALLANLTTTSEVLVTKTANLEQMMVTYPLVTAGAFSVAPGDGKAHFGLVLNASDPPPCTKGYEGTERPPGNATVPLPLNTRAHCALPEGSETSVRGAQNAPGSEGVGPT